jgi:hypothetical protein
VRRVLVTHVDSAMGRRLVKALFHDPDVSLVFATGTGPTPSFLGTPGPASASTSGSTWPRRAT